MQPLLHGFVDELVKIGFVDEEDARLRQMYRDVKRKKAPESDKILRALRGHGRQVSRDYLASMILGAVTAPLGMLVGKKISRMMHNRDVMKAISQASSRKVRRHLRGHLHTGPTVGRSGVGLPTSKQPLMDLPELGGNTARGAAMGLIFQMIHDRVSGSTGA